MTDYMNPDSPLASSNQPSGQDPTPPRGPWLRFDWERSLRSSDLPPGVKHIGLTLATYVDRRGEAWPAISSLASDASYSERHTSRLLAELARAGWVSTIEHGGHRANTYRLVVPVSRGDMGVTPVRATCSTRDVMGVTPNPERDDTHVTPVARRDDKREVPEVTSVAERDDTGVMQTRHGTQLRTPSGHSLYSTRPPEGVSDHEWVEVIPVLLGIVATLEGEGNRLVDDWANLDNKRQLCREISTIANSGKSRAAIIDALSEGGYKNVTHPAHALFKRARTYRERIGLQQGETPLGFEPGSPLDEFQRKLAERYDISTAPSEYQAPSRALAGAGASTGW